MNTATSVTQGLSSLFEIIWHFSVSTHVSGHALILLRDGPVDADLVVVDRFPLPIREQIQTYSVCQIPTEVAIVQAQCAINTTTGHVYDVARLRFKTTCSGP